MSIVPIVSLFFKSHPWLRNANVVLKNALCGQFNCRRKKYDKYTNSNLFCHFYRKHTVCFQDFVHSLGYSRNMQLTNTHHSYACGASKFQIYNVLFYLLSAKDLSYYSLLLTCCSDLSNITCWYMKLLCNVSFSNAVLTVFDGP